MLTVPEEQLQELLLIYQGKQIEGSNLTPTQIHLLNVWGDPSIVADARIQVTVQLEITEIYQNYEKNYKSTPGATFTEFIKWIAIKSMQNTPFNWRQINGSWYYFDNLPLEISVRTKILQQLKLHEINDVNHASWGIFCSKHEEFREGKLKNILGHIEAVPVTWIAYQMFGVHLPRMTSYNTTQRRTYAHQPWLVFSDRYHQGDTLYLPFHVSYSHASLTPEDTEIFIEQWMTYAKMSPAEVEQATLPPPRGTVLSSPPKDKKPSSSSDDTPSDGKVSF